MHGNHSRQFVSQIYGNLMGLAAKHMAKSQLAHLLGSRINQLLIAIAQRCAPESSQTLKVFITVFVPHITALTPIDTNLLDGFEISGWVN